MLDVTVYTKKLTKAELAKNATEFANNLVEKSDKNVGELYVAFKRLSVFADSGVKALQDKAKEFTKNLTEGKGTVTVAGAKVVFSPGEPVYDFSNSEVWQDTKDKLEAVKAKQDDEIKTVKEKYQEEIETLERRLKNIEGTLLENGDMKPAKYKADTFRVTL